MKKIIRWLIHYHILSAVLFGAVFYIASPRIWDALSALLTGNVFLKRLSQEQGALWTRVLLIALTCMLYGYMLMEQIYADHTNGRSYHADHHKYDRPYRALMQYFQDADPHRMDPQMLPKEQWYEAEGVILGKVGDRLIRRPSAAVGNLMLFALPGQGKTTCQCIPTALRFAGGVFAIDIKGDIYQATKDTRNIKMFNPVDESSCHFNPFRGIKSMNEGDRRLYLENLAFAIVPQTEGGSEGSKYFTDGARDFFCGIGLHMLHDDPDLSFPDFVIAVIKGNFMDWTETILHGECIEAQMFTNNFYGQNEKNVSGCYGELVRNLRPFMDGALPKLLTESGEMISPDMLDDGYDVYIELPQDKIEVFAPMTSIIIQSFITAFMNRPDQSTGVQNRPIIMLLDEFRQYRFKFETLTAALSTLRSKGVSLMMIQQSKSQLENRYGEKGVKEIVDTCAYISIMGAQEPGNRKWYSDLIGTRKVLKVSTSVTDKKRTRSVQEMREPIYQPEDFGSLNRQVIIYAAGQYIKADTTYYKEKESKKRVRIPDRIRDRRRKLHEQDDYDGTADTGR